MGWSTAEWRGHNKPELSLSGNAGDSLADYGADFFTDVLPTTRLMFAALDCVITMVDNGPAEPPSRGQYLASVQILVTLMEPR